MSTIAEIVAQVQGVSEFYIVRTVDEQVLQVDKVGDSSVYLKDMTELSFDASGYELDPRHSEDKAGGDQRNNSDYTIAGNGSLLIDHTAPPFSRSLDPDNGRIIRVLKELVITGTSQMKGAVAYDPENFSTNENNLIDGNVTNLCYNNSSQGPVGKWFGVDLGESREIGAIQFHDYTSAAYIATHWRLEYSNDTTTWITALDVPNHTHSPDPTPFETNFTPVSARYWRVICVTAVNASWWIVSELELFSAGDVGIKTPVDNSDNVEVHYMNDAWTRILNKNRSPVNITVQIFSGEGN